MTAIQFDPFLPWPVIGALALLAASACAVALWRGLKGWALRALALAVAAFALAGPMLEQGTRRGLKDIVILVEDRSASQSLPGRAAQSDAAAAAIMRDLAALPDVELRRVTVGDDPDGTLLGQALTRAIAAEPEARLAGVIAITDGQSHDAAQVPRTAPAPVHVLLTGGRDDWDRRLVIEDAPAYGIIGQPVTIRLRIEDQGAVPQAVAAAPATLRVSIDGGDEQAVPLAPGVPLDLPVTVGHAGQNVIAIRIDAPGGTPAQLTDRNDGAAIAVEGVRDRLRVLLVSGQPHPGERAWRNLLKSDANVDLVHFTILRSADKFDGVPSEELALIAFPTEELFQRRLSDFDLIIFDRYSVRGVLLPEYYDNIRRYVEDGGAVLVSAGPEAATVESLSLSPLAPILPAHPTGRILDGPFRPELTPAGQRHPVTAGLPGAEADAPDAWGRWLRMGEVVPGPRAEVVMTGAEGKPLLVLSRQGKGRVAYLASEQVWLWGRGFEGGGPQLELLRRIAHWEMKEPELEEETLLASVDAGMRVTVTRRTLKDRADKVAITGPDGQAAELTLDETTPGRFAATWQAPGPGLYRLTDGTLTRVLAVGPAAPKEFERTVASADALAPLAAATGGGIVVLADGVPSVRPVRVGANAAGAGIGGKWIGITPRGAEAMDGVTRRALLPGWAWLALIAALSVIAWLWEGGALARLKSDG